MSDFISRLGDALAAAAERQAAQSRPSRWSGYRDRLRLPRRASTRALVLIGAVGLAGAGGTAGLLAGRGEVGGPPSLTFARVSPQQRAAGTRPLTRPVVFARGRLASDGRPWQLVGFQTTRGLCVEIDFPRQQRAGGCGSNVPREGRTIDWQAQIEIGTSGVILGAVDPAAATVRVRHGGGHKRAPAFANARVVHVRDRQLLAALGLRKPFAYYLAELEGGSFSVMRAEARDARGALLARVGIPSGMNDTSGAIGFMGDACPAPRIPDGKPRRVSTMPPAEVLERLAVLRRPQRLSDRLPRQLREGLLASALAGTVEVNAIRRLGRAPTGEQLYLVPTTGRAFPARDPSCLRTLTPHQRERDAMLQERARRVMTRLSLTLYAVGPRGAGSVVSFDLDRIRSGKLFPGRFGGLIAQVIPDGVATVEVRFDYGIRRVAPVRDNLWTVTVPTRRGPIRAREAIWRDAHGRVVNRLRQQPSPQPVLDSSSR